MSSSVTTRGRLPARHLYYAPRMKTLHAAAIAAAAALLAACGGIPFVPGI